MMDRFMMVENHEGKKGMFHKDEFPSMHPGAHMGPYRRGLEEHQKRKMDEMLGDMPAKRMRNSTTAHFNGGANGWGPGPYTVHDIVGPRSAQGLVTIKAQYEPRGDMKMLPAHSLVFRTKTQSSGTVNIDNFSTTDQYAPIIGVTLEDALDATKLMSEHASRRTIAIAVDGVVALHCPHEFAKEFVFGDPVYVNPKYRTEYQKVPMLLLSCQPADRQVNCRIGTFVEEIDARTGGIRLKLGIGCWEQVDRYGRIARPPSFLTSPASGSGSGSTPSTNPPTVAAEDVDRETVERQGWFRTSMKLATGSKKAQILGVIMTLISLYKGIGAENLPSHETWVKFTQEFVRTAGLDKEFVDRFTAAMGKALNGPTAVALEEAFRDTVNFTGEFAQNVVNAYISISGNPDSFGNATTINYNATNLREIPDARVIDTMLNNTPLPTPEPVGVSEEAEEFVDALEDLEEGEEAAPVGPERIAEANEPPRSYDPGDVSTLSADKIALIQENNPSIRLDLSTLTQEQLDAVEEERAKIRAIAEGQSAEEQGARRQALIQNAGALAQFFGRNAGALN